MSKFIVEAEGTVETKRHRTLEVWAKSPSEALDKAKSMFLSAINRSKSFKYSLKNIEVRIKEDSDGNS